MKKIIINVDDLGLSDFINQAVVDLAYKKRVTATSFMVAGSISDEHKAALHEMNIDIGLHLDFTGIYNSPLTSNLKSILFSTYTRRLDKIKVITNIKQQFDLFEEQFGYPPIFVDGHQHVHQFPIIRNALIDEIIKRSNGHKIYARITKPLMNDFKSHIIYRLGGNAWQNMCHNNAITTNSGFTGVYGFDKNTDELKVLWQQWIKACKSNINSVNLIMCHPAKPVTCLTKNWNDEIKIARETEYNFLMSDDFGELITNCQLVNWQAV